MYSPDSSSSGGQGGWLGRAIVVLFVWVTIAALGYYAVTFFTRRTPDKKDDARPEQAAGTTTPATTPAAANVDLAKVEACELGIAYGTEKRDWLEPVVKEFAKTEAGRRIKIKLYPMGSLEAAHAILRGDTDQKQKIHVWSPASSLYRASFVQDWQLQHTGNPILKEETLALSPMVFVMWKERYDAMAAKYNEMTFQTVSGALDARGGWGGIANRPEWGLFKFGHTHPNESNSGLVSLVLMAYDFHNKTRDLTLADVVKPELQDWLAKFEHGVSGLTNSTANLMNDMVLKGPSTYDAVLVYESVAIDFLPRAEGRWGELFVAYPKYNLWNDNPYYILNTEWTTKNQQEAAELFLNFLMSDEVQKQALDHGFRPGNAKVPVKFPDSPFIKYAKYGLKIDLATVCDPPSPEVINNLQQSWQRAAGRR